MQNIRTLSAERLLYWSKPAHQSSFYSAEALFYNTLHNP